MDQQNLDQIKSLMDEVAQTQDVTNKRTEEKEARSKFNDEFRRLKKEVIWPVMVEVGNEINKYGHDYHVDEEEERVDTTAHEEPSSIQFNIYPAGVDRAYYTPDATPYIKFYANSYAKKVGIEVSTMMPGKGGTIGVHGEYAPDQMTKEFIEKEMVAVLKGSMIFEIKK
jgi:hypothetical protein